MRAVTTAHTSRRGGCVLVILLAFTSPASGWWQPGGKEKTDSSVILPPSPQPPPPPQPTPSPVVQLSAKQFYVVQANVPVTVVASPDGILKVTRKPGTVTVCGDLYGYADDCVDFAAKDSVYLVRGATTGTAELIIVNGGAVIRKTIVVGDVPPPNPISVTISPTSATVQVGKAQQFGCVCSSGAVKWTATGAGTVDTTGLFTAGSSAGMASVVVTSLLDPSKTATATVTVTDGPTPGPAPIPVAGFRFLIVYDVDKEKDMPPEQNDILYAQTIRAYGNARAAKGATRPEWNIWDKSVDVTGASQLWKDAMKRDRKSLPWLLISNGKTGFEGPLPGNVADTLKLLQQYGG